MMQGAWQPGGVREASDPPAGDVCGFVMPSLGERAASLHNCLNPKYVSGRKVKKRKCLRLKIRPHAGQSLAA